MPRRALIVDNDAAACELMRSVLSSAGMDVLVIAQSVDAPQYLNNEKFAVLIFEVQLPAPDGNELARVARHSEKNQMTPVILVSENQDAPETSPHFIGASFFLQKPIEKGQLLKLLHATQGAVEHEKRRFRRVSMRTKVRLSSDEQDWEGETVDVSLNGLLVKGSGRIAAGTPVSVSLFLPGDSEPVVGVGRVTRVQGQDLMGVFLNRLNMVETSRLQDFLLPMILETPPEARTVRQ